MQDNNNKPINDPNRPRPEMPKGPQAQQSPRSPQPGQQRPIGGPAQQVPRPAIRPEMQGRVQGAPVTPRAQTTPTEEANKPKSEAPKPMATPPPPSLVKKPRPKIDPKLAQPEVVSILKLRKKKSKDLKLEKERLKRSGRIASAKHLRMLRKGLEVPRYRVHPEYGLTNEIVERRIDEGVTNDNLNTGSKSYKRIVLTNIFTFFNLITIALTVALITVGAFTDLTFSLIVIANIALGIYQEVKAKQTMDELSIMSQPVARVLREGNEEEVHITEVVLDDVVILDAGDQIVVDSMLLDGVVEVNESMLTGESDAIVKQPGDLLYGGSYVVSGQAKAKVEHTGKDNFMEKLTNQVKKKQKTRSDLLSSLNIIMRVMSVVIVILGILLFNIQYEGLWGDMSRRESVRSTAGAMVGMIPAGLFLVSSMALYIGVVKLSEFNVLVRELYCIEMLAKINVLCLDKTGTITDGTMQVKNIVEYNTVQGLTTKSIISAMLNALNDRNMTSKALEEKFGLAKRIPHVEIMPFTSIRKYSAVQFVKHGTFALGAPEIIMKHRYNILKNDVEKFSKSGYRVLLLAHSKAPIEDGKVDLFLFEAIALILIEDNIRPDAIDTIDYFKKSGVDVKVISGDNPMTVSKISERAGINNATNYISLDGIDDDDVIRAANRYTVFGRVSPSQKKLLVKTLKEQGKIVAMTGDGVNDILALKEADCSIAVASGSDAARSVSHLVLLDSNFSSMPRVVTEGRRVINNIAKVATLFLAKVIFSLLLSIHAIQNDGHFPISAVQFLMIDVLVIFIPSAILILEPNNEQSSGNFLLKIIKKALPGAVTILIMSILVFALNSALSLNVRESSTIIVIAATFTMMMVLYDISTPLNKTRKLLFNSVFFVFVFFTVLFPRIFDFSPLLPIGGYFDSHLSTPNQIQWPVPVESQNGFLIVDNMMTRYAFDPAQPTGTDVALAKDANGWFLRSRGRDMTTIRVELPSIQGATNLISLPEAANFREDLVFDAHITNHRIYEDVNTIVKVASNGNVYLVVGSNHPDHDPSQENGIRIPMNVLPTVGISSGSIEGYLVINNHLTDIRSPVSQIYSTELHFDKTVNRYRLWINGTPLNPSLGLRYAEMALVDRPPLSRWGAEGTPGFVGSNDGIEQFYAVGGLVTMRDLSRHSEFGLTFRSDGELLFTTELIPTITSGLNFAENSRVRESRAGYWVIFGVATHYRSSLVTTQIQFAYSNYRADGVNRLILNGQQTHIALPISYIEGGIVPQLPLNGMLLLVFLCAGSLPLLRVVKGSVPWARGHISNIKKIISKVE